MIRLPHPHVRAIAIRRRTSHRTIDGRRSPSRVVRCVGRMAATAAKTATTIRAAKTQPGCLPLATSRFPLTVGLDIE